ncbi:MAG TPA: glycosyltransferase family 4 protein, partial [Burkholderiales bacterium]
MRIALVRQRYNPHGGAERFIERVLGAFPGGGATFSVFARRWTGARAGIEVVRCDPFYLGRVWRDAGFERAVCRALAARRFDLVQSHERIACCDIYRAGDGVHAQWLENRRRALGPVGRLGIACNPAHRYTLAAERRLFASPRLRAVICNSQMVKDDIAGRFGVPLSRLHVIYNAVASDAFSPALRKHRRSVRAQFGIPEQAPLFLQVGSGFERKGVATSIDALAQLQAPSRLIVVGGDKDLRRYEARARRSSGRVTFAGPQSDPKPFYGAADAFVLPTLYDPCPNAALEAMACALPIVTST